MRPRRWFLSGNVRTASGVAAAGSVAIAVAAGSLAVGGALLTATADAVWAAPVTLSSTALDSDVPAVAESADGSTSAAVWLETGPSVDTVRSAHRGSSGWSAPVDLDGVGVDTASPQIALSADGSRSAAVWKAWQSGSWIVRAATRTAGAWSAPASLSAAGHSAQQPHVAMSADGTKAAALWYWFDGAYQIVHAATWDGSAWSPAVPLSAAGQSATWPRLAMASTTGAALAVWTRWNGSEYVAQWSRWDGSSWSAALDLSAAGVNVGRPQPSLTPDGAHATVVWQRYDANPNRNYVVQATSWNGSTWTATQSLSSTSTTDTDPQVGVGADGDRAVVVWHRRAAANDAVEAASRTGGVWSSVTTVSSAAESAVPPYPQVGVSAAGASAIAAWSGLVAGHYAVLTAAWNGSSWSAPAPRSDPDATQAVLATSGDAGRAVAGWLRYDGSHAVVEAAVMAPAPPPASSPVTTTSTTTTSTTPPPPTTAPPPTRTTTRVVGWPTKPVNARLGRGTTRTVTLRVTVVPAKARRGTVQVWGKCRVVGRRTVCRWVTYRVVAWPNRWTGLANVVLAAAKGRRATYRLVLPATSSGSAATTRPLLVVGS